MACERGDRDMVALLVASGADISIVNKEGESPMDCAKYREFNDVIKLLEEAKKRTEGWSEGQIELRIVGDEV